MKNFKQAFTMIELIFAIVIVGILASVAIPRLSATRDDAVITKARTTVASVRNALSMQRQKRILRGDFRQIEAVGGTVNVFGHFDNNASLPSVLEYPIPSEPNSHGKWEFSAGTGKNGRDQYIFNSSLGKVYFEVVDGKFECDSSLTNNSNSNGCNQLTR
jgi:general secretion pathway protein G